MHAVVEELTLDPRGALWGLYRWHGIHGASSAALVVSTDDGRMWIAGHGVYRTDAKAERWERVWPK